MKKLMFSFIMIILFSSCATWKYKANYDHKTDFSHYKTFGLLNWDPHNDKVISPKVKNYILMAIKKELEDRGYTYQKNGADLQVSVFAIVQEETNYSAYVDHYNTFLGYGAIGVGVGVGSGGVGVGVSGYGLMPTYPYNIVKHDYSVGTVVIDLLDNAKKQIVWQGVASGRLTNEDATEGSVNRKVSQLFSTLPVKKLKKKDRSNGAQ